MDFSSNFVNAALRSILGSAVAWMLLLFAFSFAVLPRHQAAKPLARRKLVSMATLLFGAVQFAVATIFPISAVCAWDAKLAGEQELQDELDLARCAFVSWVVTLTLAVTVLVVFAIGSCVVESWEEAKGLRPRIRERKLPPLCP